MMGDTVGRSVEKIDIIAEVAQSRLEQTEPLLEWLVHNLADGDMDLALDALRTAKGIVAAARPEGE